jgi:hypothetical protein
MSPSPLLLKAVRESRNDIAEEYAALCGELDFQKKFKLSVKQHPFLWLSGAAGAGLLTTLFGIKRSASSNTPPLPSSAVDSGTALSKIGWLAGALEIGKLLYPILRPVVMNFAQKSIQSTLAKRTRSQ